MPHLLRLLTALLVACLIPLVVPAASAQTSGPEVSGAELSAKVKKSSPRRSPQRHRQRVRGQRQPATERVREIQQALIREGYLAGQPSGKWDAATTAAMRRFQYANGYPETGKPDALSLIKLGLGPQTAGKAPPRPVTSERSAGGKTPPR